MARDRKRHASAQVLAGAKAPQGKRVARAAACPSHSLPAERALFLHLIRMLAREAARADYDSETTACNPSD